MKKTNESQPQLCAFLRGVNVKGTTMKMDEVCALFEKTGMTNVTSVLASGNISFTSEKDKKDLKSLLEKAMSKHFNYEAYLFIKDKHEIETILRQSPYATDSNFHIYGFVGIEGIEKTLLEEFNKRQQTAGEEAKIAGGNFYWKVPKGYTLGSEFGKILGKKNLKDTFTSRNMNSFEKILQKM